MLIVCLSKVCLESGKLEVVWSIPLTGAGGETFIEKKWKPSKEIIDWLQPKAYLAVCYWLSIGFNFVSQGHLQTQILVCQKQATVTLKPPQSNGTLV